MCGGSLSEAMGAILGKVRRRDPPNLVCDAAKTCAVVTWYRRNVSHSQVQQHKQLRAPGGIATVDTTYGAILISTPSV